MFSIKDFKSHMKSSKGVMKDALFVARFHVPKNMKDQANHAKNLQYFTVGATDPGGHLLTTPVYRHGYGVSEKMPYSIQFNDALFQILYDGRGDAVQFFKEWQRRIINYGQGSTGWNHIQDGFRPYEVSYKTDYTAPVEIISYRPSGNEIMTTTLHDAFPSSVGDVMRSWENTGLARLPVTMSFTDFKTEVKEAPSKLAETLTSFFTQGADKLLGKLVSDGSLSASAGRNLGQLANHTIQDLFGV